MSNVKTFFGAARSMLRVTLAILTVFSSFATVGLQSATQAVATVFHTDAITLAFQAGNIISDYNFYNSSAMTEAQIQSFLSSQVGSCKNENCLADLRFDTPNRTLSFGTCASYPGAPRESVARIIFKVQQLCGLSSKVMLTMMQKEQSLVTDPDPSPRQLRSAMGYGCPDTAACDEAYYGLFMQLYTAARQLIWYGNSESSFYQGGRYRVGSSVPILFHPNADCGSSNVYISNKATAALYFYTPYQPNQAALDAGWTAANNPCSSYGNRNFWNIYYKWFGDPLSSQSNVSRVAGVDRYDTAAKLSQYSFPGTADVVYIANSTNFSDALTAGAAAAHQGAPLLLSNVDGSNQSTKDELVRLRPKQIILVGGTERISENAEAQFADYAAVARVHGADRYETSRNLARYAFSSSDQIYVVNGTAIPDGLVASAAAGSQGDAVILVSGTAPIEQDNLDLFQELKVTKVKLAGGVQSLSADFEASVKTVGFKTLRLGGINRFETSVLVAQDAMLTSAKTFLASGVVFADALTGSVVAAMTKSPLMLANSDCVQNNVRIESLRTANIVLIGGPVALGDGVSSLRIC